MSKPTISVRPEMNIRRSPVAQFGYSNRSSMQNQRHGIIDYPRLVIGWKLISAAHRCRQSRIHTVRRKQQRREEFPLLQDDGANGRYVKRK